MDDTLIEEVTFYPVKPSEKGLIGFSTCLFEKRLALNSIAIYTQGNGNIRLVFPNTFLSNGKKINVFYPINGETYEAIRQAIAKKIETVTKEVLGEEINARNKS